MPDEKHILYAEIIISKIFAESNDEKAFLAKTIKSQIKQMAKTAKITLRRNEISAARLRLGIQSKCVSGEYEWTWTNETDPEEMWKQKSRELFGGGNRNAGEGS